MRILIVGVGGVGAMAAWRLAKSGHSVTALEQFEIDHDRGSSYGESRIVRRVYPNPLYTALMDSAYKLWYELMHDASDDTLFVPSGGIFFAPKDHPYLVTAQEAMQSSHADYEMHNADECRKRFPAFHFNDDEAALYDPNMGYACASRSVLAAVRLAKNYGAEIQTGCKIISIAQKQAEFDVTDAKGRHYQADRLLISAGAWINDLLAPLGVRLPITVTRQPYIHLLPFQNPQQFLPERFPVWIDTAANAYGFPQLGNISGVKIGIHDFGEATTPETVDRSVREEDRQSIVSYASKRFPDLVHNGACNVGYEKVCLYSVTPTEDFIVDAISGMPGAFVFSPCSGHGFKFTPLMGEFAAYLLTDRSPPQDLAAFRIP